jgi:hypothetical protein
MAESKSAALPLGDAPPAGDGAGAPARGTIEHGAGKGNPVSRPILVVRRAARSAIRDRRAGRRAGADAAPSLGSPQGRRIAHKANGGCRRLGLRDEGTVAIRRHPAGQRSVAQPGSALRSGRRGRRFKSYRSDHCPLRFRKVRAPSPEPFFVFGLRDGRARRSGGHGGAEVVAVKAKTLPARPPPTPRSADPARAARHRHAPAESGRAQPFIIHDEQCTCVTLEVPSTMEDASG